MTVAELIAALEKMPQDARVVTDASEWIEYQDYQLVAHVAVLPSGEVAIDHGEWRKRSD